MFVVCSKGHLVRYWAGESRIFLDKESCVISSRHECLEYLQGCGHDKNKAVEIITTIQKQKDTWFSV